MINRDPARGKVDVSNDTEGFLIFGKLFKVKEEGLVALWKHNNLSFAVFNLKRGYLSGESLGDGSRIGGVLSCLRYLVGIFNFVLIFLLPVIRPYRSDSLSRRESQTYSVCVPLKLIRASMIIMSCLPPPIQPIL